MSDFYLDVKYNETGTIRSASFTEEDVVHYGKKGMKWGVRNRSKAEDKARGKKFGPSGDYAQAQRLKKRPPSSLNNKQLETLNKRMQLEKSYNDLTSSSNKSKAAKGLDKIEKGTKVAKTLLGPAVVTVGAYKLFTDPKTKDMAKFGASFIKKSSQSGAAKNAASTVIKTLAP